MGPEQFTAVRYVLTVRAAVGHYDTRVLSCYQRQCFKLTNSTQSNVAEDDDDENNTANHIGAAPGGGGGGGGRKYDNKYEMFDMETPRL